MRVCHRRKKEERKKGGVWTRRERLRMAEAVGPELQADLQSDI